MNATDFATHLTAFLTNYLPAQRNIRPNTIKAYRDTVVLLLRDCRDVRGLKPERLTLAQIDPPLVKDFLDHLGRDRNWAGHVDIKTTEIYARADMEMKRTALDKAADKSPSTRLPPWQKDADLLQWLSSL